MSLIILSCICLIIFNFDLFQLDYKVDEKKLKDVFKLAGRVVNCEINLDKEGKSRGFGVVEYEHPVEAVQAICILLITLVFVESYSLKKKEKIQSSHSLTFNFSFVSSWRGGGGGVRTTIHLFYRTRNVRSTTCHVYNN